jgi:hypothetical protein
VFIISADLGGQLGLFLGASIMTGMEIIDLICHLFLIFVRRKCHYRSHGNSNGDVTSREEQPRDGKHIDVVNNDNYVSPETANDAL